MRAEAPSGAGLVGVFGGTFDPIHLGHLRAAEQVVELLGLERLLFVPAGEPPHKRGERRAPARLRYEWVRRAIAGNKRFEADAIEVERAGPSWSVLTLREIGARVAPLRPVFVVGSDALAELASWREPEAILELAHLAVMARPGRGAPAAAHAIGAAAAAGAEPAAGKGRSDAADRRATAGPLAERFPPSLAAALDFDAGGLFARHRHAHTWVRWLPIEPLDVSATEVRALLRAGRSVRYLVPEAILDDLVASGVYAEAGPG
jgi:nicotinate-nucleotide adenylyltransferase